MVLICLALVLAYRFGSHNHDFFTSKGIPGPRPLPFVGNTWQWLLGKVSFFDVFQELYQSFKEHKLFGLFDFMGPVYVLRDFDLVKQVCIKDFDSFTDRRFQFNEESDPLFSNALFAIKGTRWRNMRAILSPAFTGSKMRGMFQFITDYCQKANDTVKEIVGSTGAKEVDIRDIFNKYSNDIIASCAFGWEMNVLRDGENEFYRQAKHMTHLNTWQWVKFMMFSSFPRLAKILRIRLFDQMTTDFMREAVRIVIEQREKNNVVRPDLIHLLMQARDQKLKFGDFDRESEVNTVEEVSYTPNWTHDDFVSQCAVFVFGGLDTVTNIASFMAHELAINQHVQVKLREEIESILNDRDGQSVTYEDIHSMVYLDQVLTETLRKWPQAIFIDRVCTKPYDLNVDGRMISLKQGDTIWIPALPMHRDPRYFSDPEVFDPDRFASDRRDDLGDFVLMAFGIGPRLCLGNRFALMEIKTMFFWLLTKFELTRSDKTQHPPKLGKSLMIPEVKDGYWLNLKLRK